LCEKGGETIIKTFKIKGRFRCGKYEQNFTKELRGLSEKHVIERLYSEIGSKHRVKRGLIHISEISEIKPESESRPKGQNSG